MDFKQNFLKSCDPITNFYFNDFKFNVAIFINPIYFQLLPILIFSFSYLFPIIFILLYSLTSFDLFKSLFITSLL